MSRKTKLCHSDLMAQRAADDKRRGMARKEKPTPRGEVYNPGTMLYNPFRVLRRPSGLVLLRPGRGSPAAEGGKA